MEINIRNEEPQDNEKVRAILRATFPTAAESKLVEALRANGNAIVSLVAVRGTDVLGHIMFSPLTSAPLNDAKGIGLAPVAVRPNVQRNRVGSQLIREGLLACKEKGFDYCVVLGDPKYYGRFGFQKASSFGIQNEYGVDEEFMVIHFSNSEVSVVVKYAPEFAMFSV